MISRRTLVAGTAALVAGRVAAQPVVPLPRIAVVAPDSSMTSLREDLVRPPGIARRWPNFFHELRRLGYVDGENVLLDLWNAEGVYDFAGRSTIIRAIVDSRPDVIVTEAGAWVLQVKEEVTDVPVVVVSFAALEDEVVRNHARPEGNITGFSLDSGVGFLAKLAQLLLEIAPSLTRIAFVGQGRLLNRPALLDRFPTVIEEALRYGVELEIRFLDPPGLPIEQTLKPWLDQVLAGIRRDGFDGLMLINGDDFGNDWPLTTKALLEAGLPSISQHPPFAPAGGLISYAASREEAYTGAAQYAHRILQGEPPADLPFQLPTRFDLVINARTAAALGLTIPDHLRLMATEVIE